MTHRLEARLSKLTRPLTASGQMTPATRRARMAELMAIRDADPASAVTPEQIARHGRIAELEAKAAQRVSDREIAQ